MPTQTATPTALRIASVSPSFTVNDVETSRKFYCDVLGFRVKDRWEENGKLMGLEIAAGDQTFFIGQDDFQKGKGRQKGIGFRVYCATAQDIDELAKEVQSRGGKLAEELKDDDWARHFAVVDPDGFKITIGNLKKR